MTHTEDISDLFTKEGLKKLKKGQLLRFDQEGSTTELIITQLNRKSGKVMAKHTATHDPKDVIVKDSKGNETSFDPQQTEQT